MDNKRLMQVLLRDARELEQLIGEIRKAGSFDPLDSELLMTRISGIRHLLEVACDSKETMPDAAPVPEKTPLMGIPPTEIKPDSLEISGHNTQKPLQEDLKRAKIRKKETVIPVVDQTLTPSPSASHSEPETAKHGVQNERQAPPSQIVLNEEFAQTQEKHILAEKFVAGRSLNDLLFEKSKVDLKFSHMPVNSLVNAVGTNERFLYTRELFEGNMDSFNDTLQKLDAMLTIQEAADFLRENFQWNKSETSLRFIDLIKRRFIR
jgi:hypothetical protein